MKKFEERIEEIKKNLINVKAVPWEEVSYLETKYNLVEQHDKFIRIIEFVDSICKKNDIKYSITYGTLIGALRHGNFIPWDDDADIMMTREEFNKFKTALKNEPEAVLFKILFTDRFSIKELYEEGIFIDIFVIDYAPASASERKRIVLLSKLMRLSIFSWKTYAKKAKKMNFIKKILFFFAYLICMIVGGIIKLFMKNKLVDMHENMIAKCKNYDEKYMVSYTGTWSDLALDFCSDWFADYSEIELRGRKFMVIRGAVELCINTYGDYMSMPPEERRVPEHEIGLDERQTWQLKVYDLK